MPRWPSWRVTAMRISARLALAAALVLAAQGAIADGVRITLDPATRYQTFSAWEATVDIFWPRDTQARRDEVFDRLLDEVGITRLRVGIFSGTENTDRSFEDFVAGRISQDAWRARRYATQNDDDDPRHINWKGFDFANLDQRIDTGVLPLMKKAKARGRKLEINLAYSAITGDSHPGRYIHTDPEEYAEFMLAAFLHMQQKYRFVPDAVEVLLEPEAAPEWNPELLGRAMAAMTARLGAAGFSPRLIAPSVADARDAVPWIMGIAKVPGATENLRELSYHRYLGGQRSVLEKIGATAKALGLQTSMLELWGDQATDQVLFNDLTAAGVSAWQGSNVAAHYMINPARASGPLILKENVRYFRQYTAYIRPGDRRIAAISSDRRLASPVAFTGPDGSLVIVIRASAAGQAEIPGLPAGTYHVSYAVQSGSGKIEQPFAVAEGTPLIVELPGPGVVTVTSRPD